LLYIYKKVPSEAYDKLLQIITKHIHLVFKNLQSEIQCGLLVEKPAPERKELFYE
jgi:hypothetical protein